MIKICVHCNKAFEVDDSDRNRNRRKYCGFYCEEEARRVRVKEYKMNGRKPQRNVKCEICGKVFLTHLAEKVTCGRECQHERSKRLSREYDRSRREAILNGTYVKPERKRAQQNKIATVEEVQKKAKEAGMSYGQYMAMLYMQEGRT